MYGGLFGDLPATKKSKTATAEDEDTTKQNLSGSKSTGTVDTGTSVEQPEAASSHFAPTKIKSKKAPVSLVQKIGSAGTSMAFVPTSIKKKSNFPVTVRQSSNQAQPVAMDPTVFRIEGDETTTETRKSFVVVSGSSDVIRRSISYEEVSSLIPSKPMDKDDGADRLEEADHIRILHESVLDPYDPFLPNDLLEYWERQSLAEERRVLEQEAREKLEQQQALRRELERQEQQNQGESTSLIRQQTAPTPAIGRGRGGISNLPAWMVKQLQQQQESRDGPTGQP